MKKSIIVVLLFSLFACGCWYFGKPAENGNKAHLAFEQKIHAITGKAVRKNSKDNNFSMDQPDMAALQEILMTMDPATGKVPRERLVKAYEQTKALSLLKNANDFHWTGYASDMGGRTRMMMFDPNDAAHKKAWAGGITGGLWYNNDVTSSVSSWIPVGDFWSNLAIRCMAYDPNDPLVFYIGTGEAETALQTYRESSGLGTGIWKSTDAGQTWEQLPSTLAFCFTTDILVRNESGTSIIYAGVASGLYHGTHQSQPTDGLFRSADGGSTWQQVMPNIIGQTSPYAVQDIAKGADGRIYIGTRPNLAGQGGTTILYSDAGTAGSWTINNTYEQEILGLSTYNIPGRVVLATAPSDANVVYALIAGGFINPADNFKKFNCVDVLRSANKGVSWTKKSMPMGNDTTAFATIAWHAMDIAVDPNNPNQVFAGGLDMHRSPDGGNNWQQLSNWYQYTGNQPGYIHADQHEIVFRPGSSKQVLFATDGGVFFTSSADSVSPVFKQHNHNFNTLQFYTCDLSPTAGANEFIGGLQDNGTLYYHGTPLTNYDMISGGDGAFCFWDKNQPQYFIASVYYNMYTFYMNGGSMSSTYGNSGVFINPADLDYNNNYLFANATDVTGTNLPNTLLRISSIYTTNPLETYINLNTGLSVYFSAVTYSPYSPQGKSTLFMGSASGRLFKVTNAHSNAPQVNEITGSSFPAANIGCIALGGSEDTLMVIFTNYGIPSVWKSNDGGQTWADKEGNLPDMPIRWGIFYPGNSNYALIATETGVWGTADMNQGVVSWTPYNTGLANVRTDMLKYRISDHTVLAATHGRGFFTAGWDILTGMQDAGYRMRDVSIYPNPSTGKFTLSGEFNSNDEIKAEILNTSGQLISSRILHPPSCILHPASFDLTNAPKGIYILRMTSGVQKLAEKKIVIY